MRYLQGGPGNQAAFTTEATIAAGQFARLRFMSQHQNAPTVDQRVMVRIGGQWYVAGSGPRHTAGNNTWQQQDVTLSSIATWYPATLTSSRRNYQARLLAAVDRTGYGTTLTYPAFQPVNSANSDYFKYQTIRDAHGNTATVTWNPAQVGGQWVVSSILMPNGSTVSYQYAGGFLSSVTYPEDAGGTVTTAATITRSVEGEFTVFAFQDAGAQGTHRNKSVWITNQVGSGGVAPAAAGRVAKVRNGAGEWTYWRVILDVQTAVPVQALSLIYEGGNLLKINSQTGVRYVKTFNFTPSATGAFHSLDQISWTEDTDNESLVYSNWNRNQVSSLTDDHGVAHSATWTDSGQPLTGLRIADGAATATSYNQFDQPVSATDALGRRSTWAYDAQGNLISASEAVGTAEETVTGTNVYRGGYMAGYMERDTWNTNV